MVALNNNYGLVQQVALSQAIDELAQGRICTFDEVEVAVQASSCQPRSLGHTEQRRLTSMYLREWSG